MPEPKKRGSDPLLLCTPSIPNPTSQAQSQALMGWSLEACATCTGAGARASCRPGQLGKEVSTCWPSGGPLMLPDGDTRGRGKGEGRRETATPPTAPLG